jgi:hypothetical protein
VYESLLFSAHLRLPRSTSPQQRIQFVKEVMDLLELWPQANDLVGFIGSGGLSVEQAKRLTIGVELVRARVWLRSCLTEKSERCLQEGAHFRTPFNVLGFLAK